MKINSYKQGFTLVEMIVSIGLFTIILFIATSAFLTVVNTDRKSRSVRIATDNLNLTLEDMQRRIRTGSMYYCGTGGETAQVVKDCTTPESTISFTEQDGVTRTTYALVGNKITREHICMEGNSLCLSSGYAGPIEVTAPEVSITGLKFIVGGSTLASSGDTNQPYVIIAVDGTAGSASATAVNFKIQTTVTERNYDS